MLKFFKRFKQLETNKKGIVFISIVLFISSLTQVAYTTDYFDTSANETEALMAFLFGWIGIFYCLAGISWLANPLLLLSIFSINKDKKKSLLFSFFAVAFCLSFLCFNKVTSNEGGGEANVISYGLGYWLWLLSCSTMFVGNIYMFYSKK